jgi:hypothetical protein
VVLKLVQPRGIVVHTELDRIVVAPYAEVDDGIIPSHKPGAGPGRPLEATDAESVRLVVAQALLRFDDERHRPRPAPAPVGHLSPATAVAQRVRRTAARRGGADDGLPRRVAAPHPPSTADMMRIQDGTPVRCGDSRAGRATLRARPDEQAMGPEPATTASAGAPN